MKENQRLYTFLGTISILYLVLVFIFPMLKTIYNSFFENKIFSLENYKIILSENVYVDDLIRTLKISIISTFLGLLLGYFVAFYIVKSSKKYQKYWLIIVMISMFEGIVIRLYGWLIIFSDNGFLSKFFQLLGFRGSLLFNERAVIIGIVQYILPFVIISVYTVLKKIPPYIFEASKILGANDFRTFWSVIFPLSLPGVFSAINISFAISVSTFIVPNMLGGPKNNMIANLSYDLIIKSGNWGLGTALSVVLLLFVVIILSITELFERKIEYD